MGSKSNKGYFDEEEKLEFLSKHKDKNMTYNQSLAFWISVLIISIIIFIVCIVFPIQKYSEEEINMAIKREREPGLPTLNNSNKNPSSEDMKGVNAFIQIITRVIPAGISMIMIVCALYKTYEARKNIKLYKKYIQPD